MSVGRGAWKRRCCQIVSDRFGIPIENILYEQGDTDHFRLAKATVVPAGCASVAGRSRSRDKVIERAKKLAAELLEASVTDIELRGGRFHIAGTDRSSTSPASAVRPSIRTSSRLARKAV